MSLLLLFALHLTLDARSRSETVLENGILQLKLRVSASGVPYIDRCRFREADRAVFKHAGDPLELESWLFSKLGSKEPGADHPKEWTKQNGDHSIQALYSRRLDPLEITWRVELIKDSPLVRLRVSLQNRGDQNIPVARYPVWTAQWNMPGGQSSLTFRDSLTYTPHTVRLSEKPSVELRSAKYSSDSQRNIGGQVPYWQIGNKGGIVNFGIAWCGGWTAKIEQKTDQIALQAFLPESETQLTLLPGERIDGPVLSLMPFPGTAEPLARAAWIGGLDRQAGQAYGPRAAAYPFIYNHWYSLRRNLSREFLNRQVDAVKPYGFDVFVLDDGWFQQVGDWTPARSKFKPGELESVFARIHDKKLKAGIWSCPWLIHAQADTLPPEVDRPPFLRKYMQAYALDLAGHDFKTRLLNHIRSLKKQFKIDWWKYDQELFGETSRHGRMKNVIALQKALAAVRREHPDLAIENCMSGGRMINVFTDGIAGVHWIRDGGRTGYAHARSNISEALGAIGFLMPAKVQRWTNRPNEVTDEEVLRCYCRSAMIGVWGASADLYKISEAQKRVILREVGNYRRLNPHKTSLLYEILPPAPGQDLAGVIYYGREKEKAAVLLFRWDGKGAINRDVGLHYLKPDRTYTAAAEDSSPAKISSDGTLTVRFSEKQLSALYFIAGR